MSSTSEQLAARSQVNEDYPLSAVPLDARKSIWSLAPLLIGFTLYSGTLFAGGRVGPAFRFPELVSLIVAGNLLLGLYAGLLSYIAARSGLSTVLMARFSFGSVGSRWVDFLLGFTQIGWYAWGSALMADLLNQLAGVPSSFNWLIVLFFTYFFCSTAYIGYQAMDWLSRIAVPAMLVLMFWSLAIAARDVGGLTGLQAIVPTEQLRIGEAITIIVGTFVSGGTQATNWSRFAKNGRTAFWSTLAAFFLANGLLIFSGAFCALVYGNEDIVQVMAQQGLLFWGLVLLFLNMWTTQDNTIYAFSVAGAHMFRTNKRTAFVLGGATVALVLAWGGIYNLLVPYLILLGTFIPPIGGVVMADYWLLRRGQFPTLLDQSQPPFNWAGIVAYLIASAIAWAAPGIKPINGIIAAVILYFILSKFVLGTRKTNAMN
ncbi:cytosine permease [Gloeocapsopsis crepidinum LEGE 06123]|uniref:Cytosine permease n=1 Tax=Gloeocapsopsis crepidinum LEGE 06123 TaxID=588587 RepID=A0ABR9UWC3_9CHRO|nr:cytosine permease [Gloeocapsopsis crepidinum]MBE9192584.1 cytosine permease [Gloeocapsopsis crepidinum LEGE 06123]